MGMRSRRLVVIALSLGLVVVFGSGPSALGRPSGSAAGSRVATISTYRVEGVSTREARTAVTRTGAAIEAVGGDFVLVRATEGEAAAIRGLGFAVTPARVENFPPEDKRFHNYREMVNDIQAVAAAHPNIVQVFTIGRSFEGRKIWAAKVSDNVAIDEAEPEVLFDGLHHAREHLTVEMTLFVLHLLAEGYGNNAKITHLVDKREVFIVFELNADGGEYDIEDDYYHYWRKNRQPNGPDKPIGTDLNRNYAYNWGCCGGSSGDPGSEIYRGASPFSAPESAALASFVDSRVIHHKQQITAAVSYHTFGQLILWPYGYTYEDVPPDMDPVDHDVFVKMGSDMAGLTCSDQFGCYTPEQSSDLYITDGTSVDWLYGEHRIFTFTFEMYPDCCDFYVPDEVIHEQTWRLKGAVLYLLKHADCPYEVIGKSCP